MGIKEEELVRFLDEYMGNNGQYMKPKVNAEGEVSFLMAKEGVKMEALNQEKETSVFTDGEGTECITCADIPNIANYDAEK